MTLDYKSVIVALTGLVNILEMGLKHFVDENGQNIFAYELEKCNGVDIIEDL